MEAHDPQRFAVLVAASTPKLQPGLVRELERAGYFTMSAHGPDDALARVRVAGCDIAVFEGPPASVIAFAEALRKHAASADLPMIAIVEAGAAIADLLESGVTAVLVKPVHPRVLYATLRNLLAIRATVEDLRASEARFRLLAELSADLVSLHAPDGEFRFVSPSARDLLGYAPEELVGRNLFELMHDDDRDRRPAGEMPEAFTMVTRLRRSDGSWSWFEVKGRAARGSRTGRITDIQCTTRDISFYVDVWKEHPTPAAGDSAVVPDDAPPIVVLHHRDTLIAVDTPPPIKPRRRSPPGE